MPSGDVVSERVVTLIPTTSDIAHAVAIWWELTLWEPEADDCDAQGEPLPPIR
jgi:hypothetical protein